MNATTVLQYFLNEPLTKVRSTLEAVQLIVDERDAKPKRGRTARGLRDVPLPIPDPTGLDDTAKGPAEPARPRRRGRKAAAEPPVDAGHAEQPPTVPPTAAAPPPPGQYGS